MSAGFKASAPGTVPRPLHLALGLIVPIGAGLAEPLSVSRSSVVVIASGTNDLCQQPNRAVHIGQFFLV